jgi:hypothetical protein
VVLNFSAGSIRKAGVAPHIRANRPILALCERCADVLGVRITAGPYNLRTDDLSGAVANVFLAITLENFNHHAVFNVSAEGIFHSLAINFVTVTRQLDPIAQPLRQITHEGVSGFRATIAQVPAWNDLRIRIHSDPKPDVSRAFVLRSNLWRNVLFLRLNKGPQLINPGSPRAEIAEGLILEAGADFANFNQCAHDGFLRCAADSHCRADRVPLDEAFNDFLACH